MRFLYKGSWWSLDCCELVTQVAGKDQELHTFSKNAQSDAQKSSFAVETCLQVGPLVGTALCLLQVKYSAQG